MNLDDARDALVQEARELLDVMEQALLLIEQEGAMTESVNAIFRAAHTIKGSAGLFALESVVAFTHTMESVLDRVRNGELAFDETMLSLMLACRDYLGRLVDGVDARQENEEPDALQREALLDLLNKHLSVSGDAAKADDPVADALLHDPSHSGNENTEANDFWHISIRLAPGVLRNGMDPMAFIRYLETLGRIVHIQTLTDDVPGADTMDVERCYLGFEIDLDADTDKAAIEQVFEFIRHDSHISILPPGSKVSEIVSVIASLPETPALLGEILVKSGAITHAELAQTLEKQNTEPSAQKPIGSMLVQDKMVHAPVIAAALAKQKQPNEIKPLEHKFIKVEAGKLDQLINLVGELVIAGAAARLAARRVDDCVVDETTTLVAELVERIRDSALNLRMVPIGEIFQRFPRVVRDLSKDLGKKIELEITGAETELDKSMVEKLSDPLMHIVRNAMDHGLESVEERLASGKPDTGILRLHAFHDSGAIVIEVSDDGKGLNKERIFAKAVANGLVHPDQVLSDADIFNLIFEPGFSTAEQVTNLSGRGVGMDVVRRNIEQLRGEVDVSSQQGVGTAVHIRLPLTLAIIDAFQIRVGSAIFVIPLDMVQECADLGSSSVTKNLVNLRGEVLPFIRLREMFGLDGGDTGRESLVVVQYGQSRAGLVVDQLVGEFQAVIKPLGQLFRDMRGISGSTILSNGDVALILDMPHLVARAVNLQAHNGLISRGGVSGYNVH